MHIIIRMLYKCQKTVTKICWINKITYELPTLHGDFCHCLDVLHRGLVHALVL